MMQRWRQRQQLWRLDTRLALEVTMVAMEKATVKIQTQNCPKLMGGSGILSTGTVHGATNYHCTRCY